MSTFNRKDPRSKDGGLSSLEKEKELLDSLSYDNNYKRPDGRSKDGKRRRSTVPSSNKIEEKSPGSPNKLSFGGITVSVRFLALVITLSLGLIVLGPMLVELKQLNEEYADLSQTVSNNQDRLEELDYQYLMLTNNTSYLEHTIRSRIGWAYPGETLYSVLDEQGELLQTTYQQGLVEQIDPEPDHWIINLAARLSGQADEQQEEKIEHTVTYPYSPKSPDPNDNPARITD